MRYLLLQILIFAFFFSNAQIQDRIEIIRDEWGVPHIYAPTDAEVAYGLAWAHAEDDFQTIQLPLLAVKQMLGSYLGKEGASADYVVGLLRAKEIVDDKYDQLSDDFKKVVEGYVAGLNAYAKENPKKVLVKGSFPITAKESIRGFVLQLSIMAGAGETITDIMNGTIEDIPEKGIGSNAFAISRKRTVDEYTYLAVNSHQPLEGPAAWYEAHLISDEGWNMLGGLFPGGATIFHGTNENLGWAHTVNYPDKIDVFKLEMDSVDDNRYRIDDQWYYLEEQLQKLRVKLFLGLKITVRKKTYWSKYGPAIKGENGVYAFKLSVLDDIRAGEQWYRMNKAQNWVEFKSALEMVGIPGFNIVYADRNDNIFYVGNAKLPYRDPMYDWRKTLPGNTSKTITNKGYHLFSELPQVLNPSSGYVFNTNNTAFNCTSKIDNVKPEDYDITMGYMVWENNRSLRLKKLIEEKEKMTWEDFLRIKYDGQLPDSLAYLIDLNSLFDIDPEILREGKKVLKILQSWDRKSDVTSIGAAHMMIFFWHLWDKLNIHLPSIYHPMPEEFVESLVFTERYLMEHFGKIDVKLGEYQFLVRGDKSIPLGGIFDVITAMQSIPYNEGKVKGYAGESYILLVKYPKEGLPIIESVNVFGASNQPESKHYSDQMDMFLNHERKPMSLDIDEVRKKAIRIYHPGK